MQTEHAFWITSRAAGVVAVPASSAAVTAGLLIGGRRLVAIDGSGLAKGLFADLLAGELADREAFVVDCAGDLRLGGGDARPVGVASPFRGEILHTSSCAPAASPRAASAGAAGW